MERKVVPKIVKSNLRGVLLSKVDGVPITNLLREYRMVTDEDLDYKGMGFTHLIEFLNAVPDVARMVNSPDKIKRVVGIALNNLNITANKSCYKFRNDVQCDLRNNINSNMSNKPQSIDIRQQKLHHTITYPTDPNQPYDFRAAFLKDRCPGYQVLKFDPNFNSGNNESDVHNKREQQPQPQHNLILNRLNHQLAQQQQPRQHIQQQMQQSQQHKTTYNELQRPVQQQRPLNIVGTVDRNENTNCFSSNAKFLTSEEDGPRAANIPRAMMLCRLQQMINEVSPGRVLPLRHGYPSCVDIMLTHVEPQHKNFFWGIIINPYDSTIDEVLNIDVHKNKFQKFEGGKRAVMFFQRYFCRVWVKSIQGDKASVFMVDFGNSEQVSANKLMTPPNDVWNYAPIAIPFKHDANKKFNIESHVNGRHRCWLTKKEGCIFEVEDINLLL